MNQKQQRIAILEFLGWRIAAGIENKELADMCWIRPGGEEWQQGRIPDLTLDLIHQAEEKLTPVQQMKYVAKVSAALSPSKFPQSFRMLHASREVKAEALIKSIQ